MFHCCPPWSLESDRTYVLLSVITFQILWLISKSATSILAVLKDPPMSNSYPYHVSSHMWRLTPRARRTLSVIPTLGVVSIQAGSVHCHSTHQGGTRASHAVCRFEADHLTLDRPALLCSVHGCVVGPPQDVVHAAVGPIVVSGWDLQHVCTGQWLLLTTDCV